jgi:DNA-binding LacI/PurR family transcriptional regulator
VLKKFDGAGLKKGLAYFVIKDDDLVSIVKDCRQKRMKLGTEIGILSYNDTPMKEIVSSGITVISPDFKEIGKKAALFVSKKQKIYEQIPIRLIVRGSL